MNKLLIMICAAVATLAAPLAYGEVIYQNDFSTRTSKGGVSSLCVSAMGTMDNTMNETAGVYWDNISIDYRNGGFMVIFK